VFLQFVALVLPSLRGGDGELPDPTVCQATAVGHDCGTVHIGSRTSAQRETNHLSYLEVLLGMEVEERERNTVARRIKDAHFPKVKTLEEFVFCHTPHIPAALVPNLAEGGYLQRSEPIVPDHRRQSRKSSRDRDTNLPFSEWTTMFPNARLCKGCWDRLTDQAHIIETGTESYRFRRTLENRRGGKK
jgi:DNA replication protein DnaC